MISEKFKEILNPDLRRIFMAIIAYLLVVFYISESVRCLAAPQINFPDSFELSIYLLPFIAAFYPISCFAVFAWDKIAVKK